jgi:protein involved in polysaccharide export with SLBB domain
MGPHRTSTGGGTGPRATFLPLSHTSGRSVPAEPDRNMPRLLVFVLVAGFAVAAEAQAPAASPATSVASVPVVSRPGDLIRTRVLNEPALSGDFVVDEQGRVVLPILNDVQVGGKTRAELLRQLRRAYGDSASGGTIKNLVLDLSILRRVSITGSVRAPGAYLVDPALTAVSDVVALAGGATPDGDLAKLQLQRRSGELTPVNPGLMLPQLDPQIGDQLVVPERPFMKRNPTAVLFAVQAIVTTLVAIASLAK